MESLGGDAVEVIALNEVGSVVGKADLPSSPPQAHHAFRARRAGIIDLLTLDGDSCSVAFGINSGDQVAGGSTDCTNYLHAFLWEHGQMIDLNAFVPPSSTLTLTQATFINDSGEIAAEGVLPNADHTAITIRPRTVLSALTTSVSLNCITQIRATCRIFAEYTGFS